MQSQMLKWMLLYGDASYWKGVCDLNTERKSRLWDIVKIFVVFSRNSKFIAPFSVLSQLIFIILFKNSSQYNYVFIYLYHPLNYELHNNKYNVLFNSLLKKLAQCLTHCCIQKMLIKWWMNKCTNKRLKYGIWDAYISQRRLRNIAMIFKFWLENL